MADTLAVIEAQLRLQYPMPQYDTVGGDSVLMSAARYDAWIADQAVAIRNQQLADEAEAVEREIRRLTNLALAKLDENYAALSGAGTLTGPQQRAMLADVTRATYFVVRILKRANIIENV